MNNTRINTVIGIGIVSILFILLIQLFWIKKNIEYQQTNIKIQSHQDSINNRQFDETVTLALKNVASEIQEINHQSSDLYGTVKQQTSNYFTVELEDTLHPYLLERLLKNAFYHQNVKEDFRYGIYDCYSDSIVYGDYIRYVNDSTFVTEDKTKDFDELDNEKLQVKLDTDVHYFSVIFPNRESHSIEKAPDSVTPWYYMIAILALLLIFFLYTLSIIVQQKKLSDIKNDFINNMTHELKTPISTIKLSSEAIINEAEKIETDKLIKYTSIIYKENKRLEQQVERVLNMAKLDKGEVKFNKEPFDLHEVIEAAKENMELNRLEDNQGEILLDLKAENAIVFSDQVHITNVIYNLLDNAIKYCDQTPRITIHTKNLKNQLEINIIDNGKGIAKENIKYLFDKFYRVPTGNLHDVKGFGLGLFYVKTVLDSLGGAITVNSVLGEGSDFKIDLPLYKDNEHGE